MNLYATPLTKLTPEQHGAVLAQMSRMIARAMIRTEVAVAQTVGREINWKYVNAAVSTYGPETAQATRTWDEEGVVGDVDDWIYEALDGLRISPRSRDKDRALFEEAAPPLDAAAYVARLSLETTR